jgi:FMN phosphatase YigB (HAD superfamily)
MNIRCVLFDLFGTVLNMKDVERADVAAYNDHVRRKDFSPLTLPESWYNLKPHDDAGLGLHLLRKMGLYCATLSNAPIALQTALSEPHGLVWDNMVDLPLHRVYKPDLAAYPIGAKVCGFKPEECLMVTANPTFGDVEGAKACGMASQVIRHPYTPRDILSLADAFKVIAQAEEDEGEGGGPNVISR